jgi:hypothetical protein
VTHHRMIGLVRVGMLAAGTGAVAVGGLAFRPPASPMAAVAPPAYTVAWGDTLATAERTTRRRALVAHDPFRRARVPADRPYDPQALEAARQAAAAPPSPRPVLSLNGILYGPHPVAVVEGIPGVEGGHLFHPGDTAGGLRVRAITRDHAVITGFDTTWTLTIREPWR